MMRVFRLGVFMVIVMGCYLTAQEISSAAASVSENERTVNELKVRLGLDEVQADSIRNIFESSESQRRIDTELFSSSPAALIRAAWRRREITDKKVMDVLNEYQQELYGKYIREREKDEELFRLRQGLLLTEDQSLQAELIISEYGVRMKELYSRLEYYVKSGEDRKKKSSRGGDLLKDRSKGLEGRNPQTERSGMTPLEKIREINREKSKRFRAFLTDEQKKRLPGYEEFQDRELESVVRNLRR